jgi:hypothetical protein
VVNFTANRLIELCKRRAEDVRRALVTMNLQWFTLVMVISNEKSSQSNLAVPVAGKENMCF